MKQELITQFTFKTNNLFSLEDSLKIQELLTTAKDEAYPILMSHKVEPEVTQKTTYAVLGGICIFFFGSGIYELTCDTENLTGRNDVNMLTLMVVVAAIVGINRVLGI